MSLQSLYNDIVEFWKNIAPLVMAHLAVALAFIWISKKPFNNRAEDFLKFFRSAAYREWKRVLSEFDLMSKIPFLVALALLIYFAILSSLLGSLAVGFSNPLAFVHSDRELWLGANDEGLNYALIELASYQPRTDIDISGILSFKDQLLNEYQSKYPEEYQSGVSWVNNSHREWRKYYQSAIAIVIVFLYVLVRAITKNDKGVNYFRLSVVLMIGLFSVVLTRYIAEQYIEQENTAQIHFVNKIIRRDASLQSSKLSNEDVRRLECHIYNERISFNKKPFSHYWISNWFDGYLAREMTTKSEHPWSPPGQCP